MTDLAVFEADHDDHRRGYPAPRRRNPRKHDVERAIVGKGHHELIDNPVLAHGPRDSLRFGVVGPLTDEVVAVEVAHFGGPVAAGYRRHVVDVGVTRHGGHRRLEIEVLELRLQVGVERRFEVVHRLVSILGCRGRSAMFPSRAAGDKSGVRRLPRPCMTPWSPVLDDRHWASTGAPPMRLLRAMRVSSAPCTRHPGWATLRHLANEI